MSFITSLLGLVPTASPIDSMVELGKKFSHAFENRETEAIRQIRTLWDIETKKPITPLKNIIEPLSVKETYENQTNGLKLIQDVEEFIIENEHLIRLALENKNSPFAMENFQMILHKVKDTYSKDAARAVSAFGSAKIDSILKRNREDQELILAAKMLEQNSIKVEPELTEEEIMIANDTFLPKYGNEKAIEPLNVSDTTESVTTSIWDKTRICFSYLNPTGYFK